MMLKSNTLHSSPLFSSLLMQYGSAAKAPFNLLKIQILLGSSLKAVTTTGNLLFRYTSACSKTPGYKWRKKEMGKDDKTLWKLIPVWYHLIPRQSSLRIKWRAAKSPGYKRLKERKKERTWVSLKQREIWPWKNWYPLDTMEYPDSGVHFSLPLLVARVRGSLKLRAFFVLRQRGRFFWSVYVVFAALLRCCTKRTCTGWRHALSPLSRLSSLPCADDFIIIAADLFSGPLRFLMKQRHYLDCLTLRSTGASERVAWQTCWRRREDLKLGIFQALI